MGAVVDPVPGCGDPLAGRYCGGMPHYSDEVAVAPRLNPDDTKAVLGVLVGDALHQTGQHLSIGRMGLRLHGVRRLALDYSTGLADGAGGVTAPPDARPMTRPCGGCGFGSRTASLAAIKATPTHCRLEVSF